MKTSNLPVKIFDVEGNGLKPTVIWCVYVKYLETGDMHYWHNSGEEWSREATRLLTFLVQHLDNSHVVGHNIIGFDLPVLEELVGWTPEGCQVTDTLAMSRLSYPDRPGQHSLESWGERLGFAKQEHEDWSVFTPEMAERCRVDVELNHLVLDRVMAEMNMFNFNWGESPDIEHHMAKIIAEQERNGVLLDTALAHDLLDQLDKLIEDIDSKIPYPLAGKLKPGVEIAQPFKMNGEIKKAVETWYEDDPTCVAGPFCKLHIVPFSPKSKDHVKRWLFTIGWEPDSWTEHGTPQLSTDSLKRLGETGSLLIERGSFSHRVGQIEGLLKRTRDDGRVGAGANPCGTPTGRMRHHVVVNIPKADPSVRFGREMRSLFTVPRCKTLVGYDAKGLELRILAHYIGDPAYSKTVATSDPHVFAQEVAGLESRQAGKTLNYAFIYGAGDEKIGALKGAGKKEGAAIKARFFKEVPKLKSLMNRVEDKANKGYLKGLDGRKITLRQKHKALNSLIQAGGAVCMKKIAIILDGKVDKTRAMKVIDMHDEAQWEVDNDYVDEFSELVHQCFVECTEHYKLRCPLAADVLPGRNWSETH